tara:strand:+ start:891 stop:1415 length:525 start_codon:yes stop_codon:yes gene_type:complete
MIRFFWIIRFYVYTLFRKSAGWKGYIGRPLFIKGIHRICFGRDFRIFPGARLEVLGKGKLIIGDYCKFGHNLFATCTDENITIGSYCVFSANIFIGTQKNDFIKNKDQIDADWFKKNVSELPIILGERCFIGHGAVILPGSTLGNRCVVGANAVVRGNYKAGSIIGASPSSTIN